MASIGWEDVTALAPDLSTVGAQAQEDILAFVNDALHVASFGNESSPKLRLARAYLAAHYGTLTAQGGMGQGGPVMSESAGGLSRSYAVFSPAGSDPLLDTTPWGKAFRGLVRSSAARAPVVL